MRLGQMPAFAAPTGEPVNDSKRIPGRDSLRPLRHA